jgi:threonine aldolase
VEANAVFVRMNEQLVKHLQSRRWHFYKFVEPDIYRLMCCWSTTEAATSDFIADIIAINH